MTRTRRFSTLAWNLGGQGGSALFGLLLVKLSVSNFSVSAYGIASLLLGLQLLVRNTALNPLLNLAIYASPGEDMRHGLGWVYHATARCLRASAPLALALFPLLIWGLRIPAGQILAAGALLTLLLLSEAFKSAWFNLLHCRDRARRYAIWILLDAASKPAAIYLAARSTAPHGALLLVAAQTAASLAILAISTLDKRITELRAEMPPTVAPPPAATAWIASHSTFLLPLVGVGLTGWITGLSDRYLVNHFLGAGPAGLYAGIYGLFSAPFLIAGGAMILAVRPALLRLESEKRTEAWRDLHLRSLIAMAGGLGAMALLLFTIRTPLVRLVLAPAYLQAMPVVPGLLIGNSILALGTFLEQIFYVRRRTSLVLVKQMTGSACALAFVALAIPRWGLQGAGWACSIYTSVEFLVGLSLVRFVLATNFQKETVDPLPNNGQN